MMNVILELLQLLRTIIEGTCTFCWNYRRKRYRYHGTGKRIREDIVTGSLKGYCCWLFPNRFPFSRTIEGNSAGINLKKDLILDVWLLAHQKASNKNLLKLTKRQKRQPRLEKTVYSATFWFWKEQKAKWQESSQRHKEISEEKWVSGGVIRYHLIYFIAGGIYWYLNQINFIW